MFGIFKKKPRPKAYVYKVQYVQCATIDPSAGEAGIVTFDFKYMKEAFVKADTAIEAQAIFASKCMLTPHVYIHDIKQIGITALNA